MKSSRTNLIDTSGVADMPCTVCWRPSNRTFCSPKGLKCVSCLCAEIDARRSAWRSQQSALRAFQNSDR